MFVDSDQSNLNSDDKSLIRGIGFEINKLRMDPPWSQDIFENSVLIRQEQVKRFMGQNTPTVSWGLSSGRNDLVGDLRVGRVAAKWWTYKKKQF